MLVIAFPIIRLIGKKLNTRFNIKTELNSFFLTSVIFYMKILNMEMDGMLTLMQVQEFGNWQNLIQLMTMVY